MKDNHRLLSILESYYIYCL